MTEIDQLRTRVAELELENQQLLEPERRPRMGWARTLLATILIVVGVISAPVAVISAWARAELVDTDSFVATFGPLAQDPAVQAMVADQATAAILDQVDIESWVSDLTEGLRGLGLPPKTEAALSLLEGPAAMGIETMIGGVVTEIVTSPNFADVWSQTLRVTHAGAISVIQDQEGNAVALAQDGTLTVQLGVIVSAVRSELIDRGVGFAQMIPEIDKEISIVQADALTQVRTGYQWVTVIGYWLPVVTFVLLAAGVVVARRRLSALTWASGGLAAIFLGLAFGLSIGKAVFLGEVSPAMLPADAAGAMYSQLTRVLFSASVTCAILAAVLCLISWACGSYRPAVALRSAVARGYQRVRPTSTPEAVPADQDQTEPVAPESPLK